LTQLHEGFDNLPTHWVWTAHCGSHGDGGVPGQTVLNLPWANAIATAGNQVILASDEPKIPFVVLASQIPGQGPVLDEFFRSRLRVLPVAQEHDRIRAAYRHLTNLAHRHRLASLIHDIDHMARDGAPHRARLDRHEQRTIAEDEIDLCLAIAFVRGDT